MRLKTVIGCLACLALLVLWTGDAQAYERYKNPSSESGWCASCHGDFTGPTSPTGSVFPNDDKHTMHRSSSYMNADCNLCHTSGDGRNPWIGRSNGTDANTGYGCVGCHGRLEDGGNDSLSLGYGAGLRQHHDNAGIAGCRACHMDSDPGEYTPVGEGVKPPYYGTVDTDADMPCNPDAIADVNENWSVGDFLGLDNDGDLLYDTADPDCATAPEADCFDGMDNDEDGLTDCADPDCDGAVGGVCDTGLFGICAVGTATCTGGEEVCVPDNEPGVEGPFGNATCGDGVDNDCDGLADADDPDCEEALETNCFDELDDDGDGLVDCADPDCDGAMGDACDTGLPGVCGTGTSTCAGGAETCVPDNEPGLEGPFGDATCEDGLDNDCDGFTDLDDPDCEEVFERNCFDGLDDDGDGLVDCADPDCDGAMGDACDTGLPGICASGTATCVDGAETCVSDDEPGMEGPFGDGSCADGLDNDCDGLTDTDDPDCAEVVEMNCFDGLDDDGDGLVDCADPDCDGATGDACDTGEPGVCTAGTLTCFNLEETCLADDEGEPEGVAYGNCFDGLDNDCDGFTDDMDPDCQFVPVEDCFDGEDNDEDGLVDCADDECEGAEDGPCDTGLPGVCAGGTYVCSGGFEECRQDTQPEPEGDMYDNCRDGMDNDCDGFADGDDPDCTMAGADVWLVKLIAHNKIQLRPGETKRRRVFAQATGDTMPQPATVTLMAEFDPEVLSVVIDPDSLTQEVRPWNPNGDTDDGDDDDDVTLFKFYPLVTCNAIGSFTIEWTARIDAVENRESDGDVLIDYTVVNCGVGGGGRNRGGDDLLPPDRRSTHRSIQHD